METIILTTVLGTIFNLWHILIAPTEKQLLEGNVPTIYKRIKSKLSW